MRKTVGSIVTFNPNKEHLLKTIETFLQSGANNFVNIWDNSPNDNISALLNERFDSRVRYFKSNVNVGFGRGHNNSFLNTSEQYDYFCILNPDLIILPDTIRQLQDYLEENPDIGLATGIIIGEDYSPHPVHKYLPSFKDYVLSLLSRLIKSTTDTTGKRLNLVKGAPYRLPVLSGCFLFFKRSHFSDLGGFDDRFFLYFEDYDISVRSYLKKKSIILPHVKIIHRWERGSSKHLRLFFLHLISGLKFYKKWGFSEKDTKEINNA